MLCRKVTKLLIEWTRIVIVAALVYGLMIVLLGIKVSFGKLFGTGLVLRFLIEPSSHTIKDYVYKRITKKYARYFKRTSNRG